MFRLGDRALKSSYDEVNDVMYLSVEGRPEDVVTEEAEETGILVDFDPASHEVVGFVLLDYDKRWKGRERITFTVDPPAVTASLVLV